MSRYCTEYPETYGLSNIGCVVKMVRMQSDSSPRYEPQSIEVKDPKKYLYVNYHGSITHNSQKLGITQCPLADKM